MDCREAAKEVNMVRYMPVEVATVGSMPIITSTGQKMAPGPIPQNAAQKAPTNEINIILTRPSLVHLKSPSTN